jgi:hypothetical protein
MTRLSLALIAVLALALAPAADAKKHRSCKVKGATVTLKNKVAKVLERTVKTDLGENQEIWGCLRAKKRPVKIISASRNEDSSSSITAIGLRRTSVGLSTYGSAEDGCVTGISIFSISRRQVKHFWSDTGNAPDACDGIDTFALGTGTRAVFLAGSDTLRSFDKTGVHVLDKGAIDMDSVELNGKLASWINDGVEKSAALE